MAHSAPLRGALLNDDAAQHAEQHFNTLAPRWRLREPARADNLNSAFRSLHSVPLSAERKQPSDLQGDSPPLSAAINLIKCAVGAGSFSLPAASDDGTAASTPALEVA